MKRIIGICILFLVFIFGVGGFSYAESLDIEGLVDNFQGATDLQRTQIIKDNSGKDISAGGIISNVGEYDFFDIVNDLKGAYFQVSIEQQKTKNNTPYQLIFLFKDKDKVKDLNKGEVFRGDGKIIKMTDERLQIALWVFCGDLTESDKALFEKN